MRQSQRCEEEKKKRLKGKGPVVVAAAQSFSRLDKTSHARKTTEAKNIWALKRVVKGRSNLT